MSLLTYMIRKKNKWGKGKLFFTEFQIITVGEIRKIITISLTSIIAAKIIDGL